MRERWSARWKRLYIASFVILLGCAMELHGQGRCLTCTDLAEEGAAEAYIRSMETGEISQLPVRKSVRLAYVASRRQSIEVQYVIEIPSEILRVNSAREARTDPSISYRLTLTQYYDDFYDNGLHYVAVSKYSGVWQSLDPQVRATEGYLRAGVNGVKWGGGFLYRAQDSPHFVPGTYATRTLTPRWAVTYVVGNDYGFYQCGQISAELERVSGAVWEFWFNICQGTIWP